MNCNQTRSPFSSFQQLANTSNAQEVIFIVASLSTIYQFSGNQKSSLSLLNERSFSSGFKPFNRKFPNLQLVMAVEGKAQHSTVPQHYSAVKTYQTLGFFSKNPNSSTILLLQPVLIILLSHHLIYSMCLTYLLFAI